MALMRPSLSEENLCAFTSQAESKFYRACRDQLSDDVLVIHSVAWVYHRRGEGLIEGEADFTLFFKDSGYLTVEVKVGVRCGSRPGDRGAAGETTAAIMQYQARDHGLTLTVRRI